MLPPQELIGVSVIVRDMTGQARAQARLRDSEEQFRTIFDLTPAGVVLIDPATGTILASNEEAARGCGYARDEFIGRPVRDVVAPAYRLQATARRDHILATGGDAFETQHITRTGELRDVEVKVRVVTIRGELRLLALPPRRPPGGAAAHPGQPGAGQLGLVRDGVAGALAHRPAALAAAAQAGRL